MNIRNFFISFSIVAISFIAVLFYLYNTFFGSKKNIHNEFKKITDCNIYESDIISENYESLRIDYIDGNKRLRCPGYNLKNIYLIYLDSNIIETKSKTHPEAFINTIVSIYNLYKSDSTFVSKFEKNDSNIKIFIKRFCIDENAENKYYSYRNWKTVTFKTGNKNLKKESEFIDENFCNWASNEKLNYNE